MESTPTHRDGTEPYLRHRRSDRPNRAGRIVPIPAPQTVWIHTTNGGPNPVEIRIHPRDVERATAKWAQITGDPARVFVQPTPTALIDGTYNEVYS